MIWKTFSVLFTLTIALRMLGFSQVPPDSVQRTLALNQIKARYNAQMDLQRGLYNGYEYSPYLPGIKGTAYFNNEKDWTKGSANYNGTLYTNILIKYDLVKDLLVVLDTNSNASFTLVSEKVEDFWIAGHHYRYLNAGNGLDNHLDPGFYDVLSDGVVRLYARRTKSIENSSNSYSGLEKVFKERTNYYLEKDGTFYKANTPSSFLGFFKDKKAAVKAYLKKADLIYTENDEEYKIKGLLYYETMLK